MKSRTLLALIMLLSVLTGAASNTVALSAPAGMQRPLTPLTAKFDDSNLIKGGVEVRGARTRLHAGTAHRGRYHLRSRIAHSPRRLVAHASVGIKRRSQSARLAAAPRAISASYAVGKPSKLHASYARKSPLKLAVAAANTKVQFGVSKEPCTCHEASALYKSKQYDKAIAAYGAYAEKILKTYKSENSDYANALMWQGYIMQEVGRTGEARAKYSKAMEVYKHANTHESDIKWLNERLTEL